MSDIPADANEHCVGPASESAGKASSCAGCPNQSECASGAGRKVDPQAQEIAERMSSVKHKLIILSGKGGVGKSTFSAQLAWALAEQGYDTGILDIDICGPSIPRMMGVENEEVHRSNTGWSPVYAHPNLAVMSIAFMLGSKNDAVIWRGPRKTGLIKQFLTEVDWGELDFLVIDAPPGTSDEHITIASYITETDAAIILTTPQEISLLDVRKEITFTRKTNIPILGVVENMSSFICPCCQNESQFYPSSNGGTRGMCQEMQVKLLGAVPMDPLLIRCCEKGESYLRTHPNGVASQPLKGVIDSILSAQVFQQTVSAHQLRMEGEEAAIMGIDKHQNQNENELASGKRMEESKEAKEMAA